jgi:hypothetical protein
MTSRFYAVIEEWSKQPFQWGVNDCCTGVCNVFQTLYGVDYAKQYRGTYHTALGALRHIKKSGGLQNMVVQCGFVEVPVNLAKRGDWAMTQDERGYESLGIMVDGKAIFAGNDTNFTNGIWVPRRYLFKTFHKEHTE